MLRSKNESRYKMPTAGSSLRSSFRNRARSLMPLPISVSSESDAARLTWGELSSTPGASTTSLVSLFDSMADILSRQPVQLRRSGWNVPFFVEMVQVNLPGWNSCSPAGINTPSRMQNHLGKPQSRDPGTVEPCNDIDQMLIIPSSGRWHHVAASRIGPGFMDFCSADWRVADDAMPWQGFPSGGRIMTST